MLDFGNSKGPKTSKSIDAGNYTYGFPGPNSNTAYHVACNNGGGGDAACEHPDTGGHFAPGLGQPLKKPEQRGKPMKEQMSRLAHLALRWSAYFLWCLLLAYLALFLRTAFDCWRTGLFLADPIVLATLTTGVPLYGACLFALSSFTILVLRSVRRSPSIRAMFVIPTLLGFVAVLASFALTPPRPDICIVP
jgi:hypothetical protein